MAFDINYFATISPRLLAYNARGDDTQVAGYFNSLGQLRSGAGIMLINDGNAVPKSWLRVQSSGPNVVVVVPEHIEEP